MGVTPRPLPHRTLYPAHFERIFSTQRHGMQSSTTMANRTCTCQSLYVSLFLTFPVGWILIFSVDVWLVSVISYPFWAVRFSLCLVPSYVRRNADECCCVGGWCWESPYIQFITNVRVIRGLGRKVFSQPFRETGRYMEPKGPTPNQYDPPVWMKSQIGDAELESHQNAWAMLVCLA